MVGAVEGDRSLANRRNFDLRVVSEVTKVFMGLPVLPTIIVLLLAGEGKPSEVVASPVL